MVMMKKIGRMRKGGNPGGFRDGSSFKLSLIWRHNSIPLHTVQLTCTIHTAHRLPSTEHCNLAHCACTACTLHCLHTVCTAVRTTVHTFSLISISAALLRALAHCTLDILNWFCSKLQMYFFTPASPDGHPYSWQPHHCAQIYYMCQAAAYLKCFPCALQLSSSVDNAFHL